MWYEQKTWRTLLVAVTIIVLTLALYWGIGGFATPAQGTGGTVVVALHSGGGDGDTMCANLGWPDTLPVICPQGEGGEWNSGWAGSEATRDDVAFLKDLTAGYDTILVMGRSQGGMMALRWACEDPRVTRVIAKSGALPRGVPCPHALDGVRVLRWHGRQDDVVPVAGDTTVLGVQEERQVFGGCVTLSQGIWAQGVWMWQKKGCGYQSRIAADWGHAGVPDGWTEWAWTWLTW